MPKYVTPPAPHALSEAARAIDAYTEQVQRRLTELAAAFTAAREHIGPEALRTSQNIDGIAQELEPLCMETLEHPTPRLVEGIGLVWVGDDDSSGMLWWRADSRLTARKHHEFNPDSDSFYDYRNSVWYQGALQSTGLAIVGPYIDAWGTDDHALTAASRMTSKCGLVGVAAADLNVHTMTTELGRFIAGIPDSVLLGAEDRVIASNIAQLSAGLRIEPYLTKTSRRAVERTPLAVDDWVLATIR